jgi:hypothetical protein
MGFTSVYWLSCAVAAGLGGGIYLLHRAWDEQRRGEDYRLELALGLWCVAIGTIVVLACYALVPDALAAAVICLPAGVLLVLAGRRTWLGDAREYPVEVEGHCLRLTEGPDGERWAEFSYEVGGCSLRAFCEDAVARGTVEVGQTYPIHASATQPLLVRWSVRGSVAEGAAICLLGVALLVVPVLVFVI